MMDEQEFQRKADEALEKLNQSLIEAGDQFEFETDFNAGALTVEFEESRTRFVVSPNTPVRQLWVSALSKSYKLDWSPQKGTFILPDTGDTLHELLANRISEQIGEDVIL